jgi:diguanylate cyclase (GGDEF)-like protein
VDPLTLALSVGTAAVAGVGTGLFQRHRLRRAEATAAGLRRELEAEQYAANHDSLTGLPNRRGFYRLGHRLVADPAQPAIACVVVDLNSFKQVNDSLGHAAGDEVLVTVARRLSRYADDNLVARLGGDEFAGLFTSTTPEWALLYPAADSLAELLAEPMPVAGRRLRVTASVGAAAVTTDDGLATALHRADSAMFRAKSTGARAACFNPALDDSDPAPAAGRPPAPGSHLPTPPRRTGSASRQPVIRRVPRPAGAPIPTHRAPRSHAEPVLVDAARRQEPW